jgi:hypothetical protein
MVSAHGGLPTDTFCHFPENQADGFPSSEAVDLKDPSHCGGECHRPRLLGSAHRYALVFGLHDGG